jgi:sulfur-carrier protein
VIRVILPANLRTLAAAGREVQLQVNGAVTQRAILDVLEAEYPALKGTIRDATTLKRRPLVRFFACQDDLSDASPDEPLPDAVAKGTEPFLIIGAMAGGAT